MDNNTNLSITSTTDPTVTMEETQGQTQTVDMMNPVGSQECTTESLLENLDTVLNQIENSYKDMKALGIEIKNIKKKCIKLLKSKGKRRQKQTGEGDEKKKEPSGFTSPIEISDQLASFLELPSGSTIPRSQVTKAIFKYVKDNSLKCATDGRRFDLTDSSNPKAKELRDLLGIEVGDEVGYFTLQKHLKCHFKKPNAAIASSEDESNVDKTGETTTVEDVMPAQKKRKNTLQVNGRKKQTVSVDA